MINERMRELAGISERIVDLPDSLGIRRRNMPQITSAHLPDFLQWLKEQGVGVTEKTVKLATLKPTQKQANQKAVDKLIKMKKPHKLMKPLLTSKDGYVIDGHHRWLALQQIGIEDLKVYVINDKVKHLLELFHSYENTHYKDQNNNKHVNPKDRK